ncbi:TPA: hypothetical protein ACKP1B_002050 [Serratia fonticola]
MVPEPGAAILTAQANVCENHVSPLELFVFYTVDQSFVDLDPAIGSGAESKRRYNPAIFLAATTLIGEK